MCMVNLLCRYSFVLISVFFIPGTSGYTYAQHSPHEKPIVTAYYCEEDIRLDGQLDEECWKYAQKISTFTQRELDFGQPCSENTKIAVCYNHNNLYIGIWAYQKAPITAKYMRNDFDPEGEDNVKVMISPFNDNRTGYLFVVNPNGARSDLLIFGGEDGNQDWNAVWDARTVVTDSAWFAEVHIPFSSLQFKRSQKLHWAVNFERDIAAKNEIALWTGWSRDNTIYAVVKAGNLEGLENISYAKKIEFKPYVLAGIHQERGHQNKFPVKLGGDLNVALSPTLKLNLTSFTDFAQVESDLIPVNLSRFSVYYPEKRQFFLEGYDLYRFYLGFRNNVFYTREIGIEDGKQVPIIAGARLFGKVGKNNIGFLNIQEGKTAHSPSTNNTVLRYKRDIGKQSQWGAILTNVSNDSVSNQIAGIDGRYETSEFLGNKNLVISAKWAQQLHRFEPQKNATAFRFLLDYPNDLIDNYIAFGGMQKGFNPALGFIRRTDYTALSWGFRFTPRWFESYGIQRLLLKPWGFTVYRRWSTGEIESVDAEIRPLGAVMKSGDRFEFNIIPKYDRVFEPFALTDDVRIPIGKYRMLLYEFQLESYRARRLWASLEYRFGDFYTGHISRFSTALRWTFNKHFSIRTEYGRNDVRLPEGTLHTNEIAIFANYGFNPRLNSALFAQYNDLDGVMSYNLRMHWIPVIGSDFYLVYNFGYKPPFSQIKWLHPHRRDGAMKLIWRFVF